MSDLPAMNEFDFVDEDARKKAEIWKKAIQNSLCELPELLERLNPVPFTSTLWDTYHGAYGDVREDVAFLFCPKDLVPEMDKLRRLDFEEKDDEQINFDNLCENLSHQLSFYDATYLALPYLVLLLEKKRLEQDFHWQMRIIEETGIILSTDIPYYHEGETDVPLEVSESYQLAKTLLRDMTKEFLKQHIDEIKQQPGEDREYLATALLSIFGDPEAAYQLIMGSWEQMIVTCTECDYFDEDMEIADFSDKELIEEQVIPAESVIGKWDKKSFGDTYVWFSNLVHELEVESEWKLPYFYGTYTCPECGHKGIVMDLMKHSQE